MSETSASAFDRPLGELREKFMKRSGTTVPGTPTGRSADEATPLTTMMIVVRSGGTVGNVAVAVAKLVEVSVASNVSLDAPDASDVDELDGI